MSNRGIEREHFGDFFGQERRHIGESERDFERRRGRGRVGPEGIEGEYAREGWGGFGSEGDWEGFRGRGGGYGRFSDWGRDVDYGRRPDMGRRPDYSRRPEWGPMEGGRHRGYEGYGAYGEYGGHEEGFNRGPGYRSRESDLGNWGGRQNWGDYGWGRDWPESRYREGYDWEGQRQGGYGSSSGFSRTGQFAGRGPRGYQRSDERIREDVNDRLTEHGEIDASDIEVHVEHGEVALRGTVDSRYTKRLAEDIADTVPGVKDIRNELRVQQMTRHGEQQAA